MTIHTAKAMVDIGDTIEFMPQWMFTNVAYADANQAIRGTVVKKYEYYFMVKLKRVRECFCYTDIMTGHARIVNKGVMT